MNAEVIPLSKEQEFFLATLIAQIPEQQAPEEIFKKAFAPKIEPEPAEP